MKTRIIICTLFLLSNVSASYACDCKPNLVPNTEIIESVTQIQAVGLPGVDNPVIKTYKGIYKNERRLTLAGLPALRRIKYSLHRNSMYIPFKIFIKA